jgi:hypothetical protein
VLRWLDQITVRWEISLSHTINIKNIIDVRDKRDPIDENIFHFVYASG